MQLVLATNNKDKVREIKKVLEGRGTPPNGWD
jgi:inosine/xanthosine triphosphate pyrophosphatase family protein